MTKIDKVWKSNGDICQLTKVYLFISVKCKHLICWGRLFYYQGKEEFWWHYICASDDLLSEWGIGSIHGMELGFCHWFSFVAGWTIEELECCLRVRLRHGWVVLSPKFSNICTVFSFRTLGYFYFNPTFHFPVTLFPRFLFCFH